MSEKCSARTKQGNECQAPAVVGTRFCALHGDPARAAELGRMGGRKNRHYVDTEPVNIAPHQPRKTSRICSLRPWPMCAQENWIQELQLLSPTQAAFF